MLKDVLTKPFPRDVQGSKRNHQNQPLTTFFENSPSAFAVYDAKKQELISWNDAFINLWQCDGFILREKFPNAGLLRIKEKDFSQKWQHQLTILENQRHTDFECSMQSNYGQNITLKIELWRMVGPSKSLLGMRVEDITRTKKLDMESRKYIRII